MATKPMLLVTLKDGDGDDLVPPMMFEGSVPSDEAKRRFAERNAVKILELLDDEVKNLFEMTYVDVDGGEEGDE